ncbi:MAG TPA: HU family DNA-binding protein [Verrucomicrobiae bacterium]|nr:HU family DNA-binding protein [Verrucomicrobiae bacterium]
MNLTKREIVARITEETGLKQIEVAEVVQKTISHIIGTLAQGGKVELRNFGIFEVKVRKARTGRNMQNPDVAVPIAARTMVRFKAGKQMDEAVLKLTPSAHNAPALV